MKNLLKNKKKLILLSVVLLVFVAGCKSYVDPTTKKVLEEFIIYPNTSFFTVLNEGWFAGIFVWPLAQVINFFGGMTDAGIGILIATILFNILIATLSIKSQVQSQRMQMIQPELNKIQAKYEGKTDDASRMKMSQEMQALYTKYQINPFSSILILFIQMPVLMAFYYAVQRASVVVKGTFLGIDLTLTPGDGFANQQWAYLVIFVAMVGLQFLSMKVPAYLAEQKKKRKGVKEKKYAQVKPEGPDQMKMMTLMSTGMIAFIGWTWPVAMSYYWAVSSLVRIIQNILIDRFFLKD